MKNQTSTKYDKHKICEELESTAFGRAYYGNALRVALDIPCLNPGDRGILSRYLAGTDTSSDFHSLQRVIMKIRDSGHD